MFKPTHWFSDHKHYWKWRAMINRCHNKKSPQYQYYWLKGIIVCKKWRESPEKYFEFIKTIWFPGCHLDKDIKCKELWLKEYSPKTLIAISPKENSRNTSRNRIFKWKTISEWCEKTWIPRTTFYSKYLKKSS